MSKESERLRILRREYGDFCAEFLIPAFADSPLLWVQSLEPEEATDELKRLAFDALGAMTAEWDVARGLKVQVGKPEGRATIDVGPAKDPVMAGARPGPIDVVPVLRQFAEPVNLSENGPANWVTTAIQTCDEPIDHVILFLRNLDHRICGSSKYGEEVQQFPLIQLIENAYEMVKGQEPKKTVVIVSPFLDIPVRLQRKFITIEHPLPNKRTLREIAQTVIDNNQIDDQDERTLEKAVECASALTKNEAENVFYQCVVEHGEINADRVWQLKEQAIRKGGLLDIVKSDVGFEVVGGLDNIKRFTKGCLTAERREDAPAHPLGVLMVGVPGAGKSLLAKTLGKETGRPTLLLDMGKILNAYVGASQANLRQVFKTVEAVGPCVLFIDEVEKALGGVGANPGASGSNVMEQLLGSMLTWLSSEERRNAYVIATANDLSNVNEAFFRAGRFDAVFFVDLPNEEEREAIWSVHRKKYHIGVTDSQPATDHWTGAEIEQCCRLANLLQIPLKESAKMVSVTYKTARQQIDTMRKMADGRFQSASYSGLFQVDRPIEGRVKVEQRRRRRVFQEEK